MVVVCANRSEKKNMDCLKQGGSRNRIRTPDAIVSDGYTCRRVHVKKWQMKVDSFGVFAAFGSPGATVSPDLSSQRPHLFPGQLWRIRSAIAAPNYTIEQRLPQSHLPSSNGGCR